MHSEFEQSRNLIEHTLNEYFEIPAHQGNDVWNAMKYIVLAPAKRIRPVLMLQIAKMLGKKQENILPAASAIEFIHTSSLILDDLPCMDNAETRRGQMAVHRKFGESTAILASIGLLMQSFRLICENAESMNVSREAILRIWKRVAQNIGMEGMIEGQYFDLLPSIQNQEQTSYINDHKTAILFESAIMVSMTLCGADETQGQQLLEYGQNIGKAFQIVDDILDAKSDGISLPNKPRKKTYLHYVGETCAREEVHRRIEKAIDNISIFRENQALVFLAHYVESQIRTK